MASVLPIRAARALVLAAVLGLCVQSLPACEAVSNGAACDDVTCPVDQACKAGACAPVAPPTARLDDLGPWTTVALRPDGGRVIAAYDATHGNLVLLEDPPTGERGGQTPGAGDDMTVDNFAHMTTRVLAGWRVTPSGPVNTDAGRWPSLALDADGTPHLAWYDADRGALRYGVVRADGTWDPVTVDGGKAANRGTYTSLAIGADGTVGIAYRDVTARGLRYAELRPGGHWVTTAIDGCAGEPGCPTADEDYGAYAGLALVAGEPRIAFYDRLRGDLKMAARRADGSWQVTTLDGRDPATGRDTGDVGRFARVAVDPNQRIGVAYYDATRGALRFLLPGHAAPTPIVVDDGVYTDPATGTRRRDPVGQYVALSFDGQGRAVMIYLDAGRLVMREAVVSGTNVLGPRDLPGVSAGCYPAFGITADRRLRGAYAAWRVGQHIRTRLGDLDLPEAIP